MLTRTSLVPGARAALVTVDVGDGLHLNLDDRLIGSRLDDRDIRVRLTGSHVLDDLVAVRVRGTIGETVIDETLAPEPNLWFETRWDGTNADDGGSYSAILEVGWEMAGGFPRPRRTRWWNRTVVCGNLDLRALGLGGFTPTVVPHLDTCGNRLWHSDGRSTDDGLRRRSSMVAGVSIGDDERAIPDGQYVHIFGRDGRFAGTLQARKDRVVATASHDEHERLASFSTDGHEFIIDHVPPTRGASAEAVIESPAEVWARIELDDHGRAVAITDHDRFTTRLSWDSTGQLTTIIDPEGLVTEIERDQLGRVQSVIDSSGRAMTLEDHRDDGLDLITAEGRVRRLECQSYDDGRVVNRDTDGSGISTQFETHGDQRTTTHPDGMVEVTTRTLRASDDDALAVHHHRLISPSGRILGTVRESTATTEQLTIADRTWSRRFADGGTTLVSTSPDGRRLDSTLRPGRSLTLSSDSGEDLVVNFDKYQRPKRRTEHGIQTNFGYDQYGRIAWTEITRHRRKVHHDERGRVTGLRSPEGWIRFVRSPGGWIEVIETPSGSRTQLARGPDGRIDEILYPQVDGRRGRERIGYDSDGLITSRRWSRGGDGDRDRNGDDAADDRAIQIEYRRDSLGRLVCVTGHGAKLLAQHDPDTGHLVELSADDGNRIRWTWDGDMCWADEIDGVIGARVERVYDGDQTVAVRTINRASAIAYERDPNGLLRSVGPLVLERTTATHEIIALRLRGLTTFRELDEYGRVAMHETRLGRLADVFFSEDIERDDQGRISRVLEHHDGTDREIEYEYDEMGRLVDNTVDGERLLAIAWDADGNIVELERQEHRIRLDADGADRLVRVAGESVHYDQAGNLTGIGKDASIRSYGFDGLNRLRSTRDARGHRSDHNLDPLGRLVYLTHDPDPDDHGTRIVWDGDTPAATLHDDGSIDIRFIDSRATGVPEALIRDGIEYLIVRDHLGSVRCVVDSHEGKVVQSMVFDPLGRLLQDTNPGWQPFGFGGGLHDATSGLVRFGPRVYDPFIGRFVSRDPKGNGAGSLNLYQFRNGDPVNPIGPAKPRSQRSCDEPADRSSPLGEILIAKDPFLGRRPLPAHQLYFHLPAWRQAVHETAAMPDLVGDHIVGYDDSLSELLDRWTFEYDRAVANFDPVWDPLDSCAGPGGYDYEPTPSTTVDRRLAPMLKLVRERPEFAKLFPRVQSDIAKLIETLPE